MPHYYGASSPTSATQSPPKKMGGQGELFQGGNWRDVWAMVLFYLHLVAFVGLAVYVGMNYGPLDSGNPPSLGDGGTPIRLEKDDFIFLGINLGIVTTLAGILSLSCIKLMQFAPEGMIHGSFIASICLNIVLVAISIVYRQFMMTIMFILGTIISLIFYFVARKRIPFSAILLKTVVDVLKMYPSMLLLSAGSMVVSFIYLIIWSISTSPLFTLLNQYQKNGSVDGSLVAMIVYSAFSLFWTSQVIENVTQTTVAGVYATFYFIYGTGREIVNPTLSSLRRSLTYSFGSVCFGSFMVAVVQTLRFLLQLFRDNDSISSSIVDCLLGMIEGLIRYFNYYAYTNIAIYGNSYMESAKSSWNLIKSRGFDAIVNDNLIGTCLGMFSFGIGLITGAVIFAVSFLIYSKTTAISILMAIIAFILSLIMCKIAFEVIGAGSTATFVCLAEDEEALKRTKPELYRAIMEKYNLQI